MENTKSNEMTLLRKKFNNCMKNLKLPLGDLREFERIMSNLEEISSKNISWKYK